MEIQQFRYASDNLGYLIFGDQTAFAIDGGAVSDIITFLKDKGLRLLYATNTHNHADHSGGAAELSAELDIPVYAHEADAKPLVDGDGRPEGVIHIHDCLRAVGSPPNHP